VKKGYSPILITLLVSIAVTAATLPIIMGLKRKTFVAIAGTLSGIAISALLVICVGYFTRVTGLGDETTRFASASFQNINFKFIFYSGVIIGSLGALMDVAVSISSSQREVKSNKKSISRKKLISSGLNVGRDIIGSMLNTLIFAYIGVSFPLVLLLTESNLSIWEILNTSFISEEIVRSLIGVFGILLVIPLTALFGGLVFSRKKK
jgi:uncharacterized membrane protein